MTWLLALFPGRLWGYIALAFAIYAAGAASAWKVQNWRYSVKELEHAQQVLADERSASAAALRRQERIADAQRSATVREARLRADADGARQSLDGLRSATDAALQAAGAGHAACVERATSAAELLNHCAGAYRDLAEKADRHVSDIQTLEAAWPQ